MHPRDLCRRVCRHLRLSVNCSDLVALFVLSLILIFLGRFRLRRFQSGGAGLMVEAYQYGRHRCDEPGCEPRVPWGEPPRRLPQTKVRRRPRRSQPTRRSLVHLIFSPFFYVRFQEQSWFNRAQRIDTRHAPIAGSDSFLPCK